YACRAGSTTRYCFGDDNSLLEQYAWYGKNSGGKTHPVGEKKPNGWGLHDMHGNVWEWCQDWYARNYYKQGPEKDPQGPTSGKHRVLHGGSCSDHRIYCNSAYHGWVAPAVAFQNFGCRVVCVARTS
ncbi:MAG: formylglycine-generating enzyme family protein, partial [Blastocatellia bacterium]